MIAQSKYESIEDPEKQESNHQENATDYQIFMKDAKTQLSQCLKFVKIAPERYSDEEIELVAFDGYNSLACTNKQMKILVKRMVGVLGKNQPENKMVFQNSGGYPGKWEDLVWNLTQAIILKYNPVAYHNFTHGFELSKFLFLSLTSFHQLSASFTSQQLIIAMFSALAHDICHPGVNNDFMKKIKSQIAEKAIGTAVLETMHASTFLGIIKAHPQMDIFYFSQNAEKHKKFATELILATDMAKHDVHVKNLQNRRGQLDFSKVQQRQFMLKALFHGCDINSAIHSNFDEYMSWNGLLTYQFEYQVELETERKVKVSEFMRYRGDQDFLKGSIDFNTKIILPLWKQIGLICPLLCILSENIIKNNNKLAQLIQEIHNS